MRVLVAGGTCDLINRLIADLKKNGHQVYLLTGARRKGDWYEETFVRYDFPYDEPNMHEVFASVDPDVVIYMGAFDAHYTWEDEGDASAYLGGLTNLLMAFARQKRGRFLYLSSECVLLDAHTETVGEDVRPDARDDKGMTVGLGELMTAGFHHCRNLDAAVVRLNGLYHVPSSLCEVRGPIERMCLSALNEKRVTFHEDTTLTGLYQADALYFLLNLVSREGALRQSLYQIGSMARTPEEEVAALVCKSCERYGIQDVAPQGEGAQASEVLLGNDRFEGEFGINRLVPLEDGIDTIVHTMSQHPERYQGEPARREGENKLLTLLRAALPFVESVAVFLLVTWLRQTFGGTEYLKYIDLYFLYVLFFALRYGQQQAVFASVLASAAVLVGNFHQAGFTSLMGYADYLWIAMVFAFGLASGYVKDQLTKRDEEADEDHEYMQVQIDDIRAINGTNVRVKDSLEDQVVSEVGSIGEIYGITRSLDRAEGIDVLFRAAGIVEQVLRVNDVAIYLVSNDKWARLIASTSDTARSLGNSFDYSRKREMYATLADHNVFVNRGLEAGLPLMASALYEEDQMRALVCVWGIPWSRLTLAESNQLAVVSALIQNAVLRANRLIELQRSQYYIPGTSVLKKEAFQRTLTAYKNAAEHNLVTMDVIQIDRPRRHAKATKTASAATGLLRSTDYVGVVDGKVYAILTNTTNKNNQMVLERFRSEGFIATEASDES